MEKYLADRSYALIYRMCQVQVFSSRLHAKGFPAIGKYEPKTPPKMAGVTKYVIGFGRYSGFARRFCRERPIRATQKPVARAFLAPGLRKAEPDSRTLRSLPGRISGSVARGCGTPPDGYNTRGIRLASSLSFFGALPECSPPGAFRSPGSETERCGPEDRCVRMPNRPGMPAPVRSGNRPARTASSEASYSVRTDTAIICFVMWRAYPSRSCDISQPRLEAHRPCLRPFPATRSPPTEGSSHAQAGSIGNAKAGTSGHMIRNGDGLRVVSEISVRFPFSARRGRPLRAA